MIEMRKEKRGEIPLLPSSRGVSIHHQVLSKFRNPIKTNSNETQSFPTRKEYFLISDITHLSPLNHRYQLKYLKQKSISQVTGSRMKCERFFIEGFYLFALFCLVFAFFVSPSLFNSFSPARKGRSVLSQWRLRIGGRSCSTQCRQCPSPTCALNFFSTPSQTDLHFNGNLSSRIYLCGFILVFLNSTRCINCLLGNECGWLGSIWFQVSHGH